MKKGFKHIVGLFCLVFWLVLNPQTTYGQADVSINVNASVISSVELITLHSIQISKSEAINGIVRINPQSSASAGKMLAIGTPNSDIRISFIERRELTHQKRSSTLIFNYAVAGNQSDDQGSSELLGVENRDLSFNDDGRFYLWIGGNIDITTALPGNYQGEFTLEIEYI